MSVAQKINRHIEARFPSLLCDACIGLSMQLKPVEVNRITHVLATTGDYCRFVGICSDCAKHQKVIQRAEGTGYLFGENFMPDKK